MLLKDKYHVCDGGAGGSTQVARVKAIAAVEESCTECETLAAVESKASLTFRFLTTTINHSASELTCFELVLSPLTTLNDRSTHLPSLLLLY